MRARWAPMTLLPEPTRCPSTTGSDRPPGNRPPQIVRNAIMRIQAVHPGSAKGHAEPPAAISTDQARAVFGQVMCLVALTLGCLALGAYIGRDLSGGAGIAFFIAGFACVFGLNIASARGRHQLATTPLFGLGLL